MENNNFSWVNQLFLWPCSVAMLNYQRVSNWGLCTWLVGTMWRDSSDDSRKTSCVDGLEKADPTRVVTSMFCQYVCHGQHKNIRISHIVGWSYHHSQDFKSHYKESRSWCWGDHKLLYIYIHHVLSRTQCSPYEKYVFHCFHDDISSSTNEPWYTVMIFGGFLKWGTPKSSI